MTASPCMIRFPLPILASSQDLPHRLIIQSQQSSSCFSDMCPSSPVLCVWNILSLPASLRRVRYQNLLAWCVIDIIKDPGPLCSLLRHLQPLFCPSGPWNSAYSLGNAAEKPILVNSLNLLGLTYLTMIWAICPWDSLALSESLHCRTIFWLTVQNIGGWSWQNWMTTCCKGLCGCQSQFSVLAADGICR